MSIATCPSRQLLGLQHFSPIHAAEIARWVVTDQELHWLAPNTEQPLTAEKVIGWTRPGGIALLLTGPEYAEPVAYGELNPMRNHPNHLWLGHVLVHPDQRGYGTGRAFVRALLAHAFDRLFAVRVSLIVFPQNKAAVCCYRRAGFTIVGEEHHRFGRSGTLYRLLRLEIQAPRR